MPSVFGRIEPSGTIYAAPALTTGKMRESVSGSEEAL